MALPTAAPQRPGRTGRNKGVARKPAITIHAAMRLAARVRNVAMASRIQPSMNVDMAIMAPILESESPFSASSAFSASGARRAKSCTSKTSPPFDPKSQCRAHQNEREGKHSEVPRAFRLPQVKSDAANQQQDCGQS